MIKLKTSQISLLLTISFCFIYFILNINSLNPDINDEGLYFLKSYTGLDADWSPLYSLYYRSFSFFSDNRESIYYASFFTTSVLLLPLSTYLLTYRLLQNYYVSILATFILFMCSSNLGPVPRIHIFNFSILTISYLFLFSQSYLKKIIFFFIIGFSTHLRIENIFLIFGMIPAYFIQARHKQDMTNAKLWFFPCLLVFCCGIFCFSWGGRHPLLEGNSRSLWAFFDHYTWMHPELVPTSDKFLAVYPKTKSLISFIYNYPSDYLHHIYGNFKKIPHELLASLVPFNSNISTWMMCLLIFFNSLNSFPNRIDFKNNRVDLIFVLTLTLPSFVLSIGLHPWERYMVALTFSLIASISYLGRLISTKLHSFFPNIKTPVLTILSLLIFFFYSFRAVFISPRSNFSRLVSEWKKLDMREGESVFFTNFVPIFMHSKDLPIIVSPYRFIASGFEQMGDWVVSMNISLVCHSNLYDFAQHTGLAKSYHEFLDNTSSYGFTPYYRGEFLWCDRKDIFP